MGSTVNFLTSLKRVSQEVADKDNAYYMFCDQDDVWLKDKLYWSYKAIKQLERRSGSFKPALIFTDAYVVDKDKNFVAQSFIKQGHLNVRNLSLSRILIENRCIGCTMMMNQALVDMLGDNYDNVRYHDWWMALIAASFGGIRFLRRPTVLYRQHGSNQVGAKGFASYATGRLAGHDIDVRLDETTSQARAFYNCYKGRLGYKTGAMIDCFANIRSCSCVMKRFRLLKYRFFKSGFIRNLGLFIYI